MAEGGEDGTRSELPPAVIEAAERLTRQARRASAARAAEYRERRERILAEWGFEARVREDDAVLVCYPAEWLEDGEVVLDRIDDRSRAVERPLDPSDDWDAVERANRAVVAQIGEEHGPVHAANVSAFADFMGNHHATRIADATEAHVSEFLEEYFPRNAWPEDAQRAVVETSLRLAFACCEREHPPIE